jgi:hypothetical protein
VLSKFFLSFERYAQFNSWSGIVCFRRAYWKSKKPTTRMKRAATAIGANKLTPFF